MTSTAVHPEGAGDVNIDRVPVCVHIGLPKTATTMLQKHLFQQHPQVAHAAHPIKFVTFDPDGQTHRFIDEICNNPSWDEGFCRGYAEGSLASLAESRRTLVVSEESISFNGIIDRGLEAGELVDRLDRPQRLKSSFGEAKIVFVIRRPGDWVRSVYLQRLKGYGKKRRSYESLDEWVRQHWDAREQTASVVGNIRYGELAGEYARLFGKRNVGIYPFERLQEDPAAFVRDLARFIGIDPEVAVQLTADRRENESLTQRQLLAAHLRASSGFGRFLMESPTLQPLRRIAGQILPGRAPLRPELSPDLMELLNDYCRDDLASLAREWDLPLHEYGYPL